MREVRTNSSARLHLQHLLWQFTLQYTLSPAISVSPRAKIADLGAGNCIWLLELAKQHPKASLHALDISAEQYPPKEFVPPNMTLHTMDILSKIPDELVGAFDVAHIRMMVSIVQGGDPGPILAKAMTMLSERSSRSIPSHTLYSTLVLWLMLRNHQEPGGYLQWDEFDLNSREAIAPRPRLSVTYTDEVQLLAERIWARRGMDVS